MAATPLYDPKDIPEFASEAEEQAFWEKHTLAAELFREPTPDHEARNHGVDLLGHLSLQ